MLIAIHANRQRIVEGLKRDISTTSAVVVKSRFLSTMWRIGEKKHKSIAAEKIKHVAKEFCEKTTLHGLKYINEEKSLLAERVIWIFVFLTGIAFSTYFCVIMWKKWEDSPVLISVDTQVHPLKDIPFPAITICNVNKVSRRKLNEQLLIVPKFSNISLSKLQITLSYMTKLDRAFNKEKELTKLSKFYGALNITPVDLFKLLDKTAPSCEEIVLDCNWLGLTQRCMEFFTLLPSDDGLCCTFNGGKYSDLDLGIESKVHEPLRVNGNGYRRGLSLVIDANVKDYAVTNGKFDGFKVLVHAPEEFPDVADRGFVLGPGKEMFVGVNGVASINTQSVATKVSQKKRRCLVEGEKELTYFANYSQSSCIVECAMKKMKELCNCRPYFFKDDKTTSLCELKSHPCIFKAYDDIRLHSEEMCACLPPCADVHYTPEISHAIFPGHGFTRSRTFRRVASKHNAIANESSRVEYLRSNVAVLHVYYKEKTGIRYITDVRFGVEDFISAMGGLLSLGLGMSFISGLEILYFLFLRRFFLWCRYRQTRWPDSKNEN